MMTANRTVMKKLQTSAAKFACFSEMIRKACAPTKPSLEKSLQRNRDNLDGIFQEIFVEYDAYKAELNEDINATDTEGKAVHTYNDTWFSTIKSEYYELVELSDEKLETLENASSALSSQNVTENKDDEQKLKMDEQKRFKLLDSQYKTEKKAIIDSITSTVNTVDGMSENSIGTVQGEAIRNNVRDIAVRIDKLRLVYEQIMIIHDEANSTTFGAEHAEFCSLQQARLDCIEKAIITKTREVSISSVAASSGSMSTGHTYLKKMDPPKFSGDLIEFPEFKRRWLANVSCENLGVEAELDRLRDNVPEQAKKMLIGEKTMESAWVILTKLYGNKTMLANKLKSKLKSIKCNGTEDHDIIINLAVEVKSIVKNLTELNLQDMLKYDDEYLSAIFKALPAEARKDWLKFNKDKYTSNWEAMEKFLEEEHEIATSTKVLLSSYVTQSSSNVKCLKCNESGHKKFQCPKAGAVKVGATKVKDLDNSDDDDETDNIKREKQKLRKLFGVCPLCKSCHTYKRRKDGDIWPSDRMSSCEVFRKKNETERAIILENQQSCPRCLSWMHAKGSNDCKAPKNSCFKDKGNNNKCRGDHSRMVCGSGNIYCAAAKTSIAAVSHTDNSDDETLMLLEDISFQSGSKLTTCRNLWDNGSNRILINNAFAKENKLRSTKVSYKISVVGGKEVIEDGVVHEIELVDNLGSVHKVWGFGIDLIMQPPDPVDAQVVRDLFPHIPSDIFDPLPKKRIDMLIGLNFFGLHPSGGQGKNTVGNLKILHSKFSRGWLLGGSHPSLKMSSVPLNAAALSVARVCKVEVRPIMNIKSDFTRKPYESIDFWKSESLGVIPPRRCNRCMKCPECKDGALIHSRREQDELDMLKKSIHLEDGKLHVSYPFIKSPECFPNNRNSAVAMAKKLEARLLNKGMLDKYNQELEKYITRGILVPIADQELSEYKGPINYISHHGVEKDSVSTPLRIVTNSSLKNGVRSLNDCLPKGPSSLNSMFHILVRFRSYETGLVFDLTKAYNSMHTGLIEKHLRRLIWRFSPTEDWKDFGFVVVAFGDRPAAEFLELARGLTADAGSKIDPEACRKLKSDCYVDDGITGGRRENVDRMKGFRSDKGIYSGTISKILALGNLNIKAMISSYEPNSDAVDLMGSKVLGYQWNVINSDEMEVLLPINISGRVRKLKPKPDLTAETLSLLDSVKLSKRVCLSVANGFIDILGIACPFTLRFKLLMKQVFENKKIISWNDLIDDQSMVKWVNLIKEAVFASAICFPRTTRPPNATSAPEIVSFGDGSFQAYAAAVYLRWPIECLHSENVCTGDYESRLLTAKARVTPLNGTTIPRSELNGLVLESRLSLSVAKALSTEAELKPSSAILLSDSECSISALESTTSQLKPYFHNRVCEIRENMEELSKICQVESIHHVPGTLNVADIATHDGIKAEEIGPDSLWQKGPLFLAHRRDLWPVTRDFVQVELPSDETRSKKFNLLASIRAIFCSLRITDTADTPDLVKSVLRILSYSNSYRKVLNILARVIRGWKMGKSKEVIEKNVEASELVQAERLLLVSAMPATFTAWKLGKLDSLIPKMNGKIIVTVGRIGEESLSRLLGVESLPILMPSTRTAFLYMMRAHCGDDNLVHKSAVETLSRSRSWVWIVRGKNLAKSICKNCPMCIRRRKEMCSQQIAKLRPESLEVCSPWTYVALDFAGPVICKGVVNARARRKCWILVYVCKSTRAVCLLATAGYDTSNFLLRHEEFVARKGAPKLIVSDQGSQLIAAGRVITGKEAPESWDWNKIKKENSSSTWEYVPCGSQHHNGLSEAMVKAMKRSLANALNPGVLLAYDELVTLLARISCSINSRPLGFTNVSGTDQQEDILMPLTPNHMLLGRSSPESPPLEYSEKDKFCERLAYVAAVETDWWKRWTKTVLPTMLPAKRWKREQDNLQVGDVVLICFPQAVKDEYVMGRITEVLPDSKNLVRRVVIRYRRKNSREVWNKCESKMEEKIVAVQRLCLLVSATGSDDDQAESSV